MPQYQKAVIKSRVFGYLPFVKSLIQAQEAYYLANGEYAAYFKDLDVTFPEGCKKQDNTRQNLIYCDDSVVIDNELSQGLSTGRLNILYCPKSAYSFATCSSNYYLIMSFYLQHGRELAMREKMKCVWAGNSLAQQVCDDFNAAYYQE